MLITLNTCYMSQTLNPNAPEDIDSKPGSVGKRPALLQVRILDEAGNDLPNGQAGGMHIGHVEHALAVAGLGEFLIAHIGFIKIAHLVDRIGFQHLDHLPGDTTLLVGSQGCAAAQGQRQGNGLLAAAG